MHSSTSPGIRINRFLADAGLGSRRSVEKIVESGSVKVNGEKVLELHIRIQPDDEVEVDGEIILQSKKSLQVWAYHKPTWCLSTRHDPEDRSTIFEDLPQLPPPFQSIGRLDQNSRGLLLITNDGTLAQQLSHPSFQVPRIYTVQTKGIWSDSFIERLRNGVPMKEGGIGKAEVLDVRVKGHDQQQLRLRLRHGHKREIRYSLLALDLRVRDLLRLSFANIELGALAAGQSRMLSEKEVSELRALCQTKPKP